MDADKAKDEAEKLTQNVMHCASKMQNNPEKLVEIIQKHKSLYTDLCEAIGALDDLIDTINSD